VTKKSITVRTSDNEYFHKDFHISLNYGIEYLHKNFGEKAVDEYLTQFAENYHAPLKKLLNNIGLSAIQHHYEKIFKIEGVAFDMNSSKDKNELTIHLYASTAVMHIKENGHLVSPVYEKTISVVNQEICRNTPYDCDLRKYNPDNGAYKMHFFKR
jgi:hypothetical protein